MLMAERLEHEEQADAIYQLAEAVQQPITLLTQEEINGEKLPKPEKKKREKGETQRLSLQLYKEGKTVSEISKERNLAYSTIEGHLAGFVLTGEIDVHELVNETKLEKIMQAIADNGEQFSSQLKQQLGDDFSYGEIKAGVKYFEKINNKKPAIESEEQEID